jgi:hypothetical protein
MIVRGELTHEQVLELIAEAHDRYGIKPGSNRRFANRDDVSCNLMGLKVEAFGAQWLGVERNREVLTHGDGGTDLMYGGRVVQMKGTPYANPYLVFNLDKHGDPVDVGEINVCGRVGFEDLSRWVELHGWLGCRDVRRHGAVRNLGYGPRWVVPPRGSGVRLRDMGTLSRWAEAA